MRLILLCVSLILASCVAAPEPAALAETTPNDVNAADELSPDEAFAHGIVLRDSNELEEAFTYVRSAAMRGHKEAQFELGLWYMTGNRGVREDFEQAAKWIEQAAQQGQPDALTYIWQLYFYGRGVAQSDRRALQWLQRGAGAGLPMSAYYLGLFHYEGIATPVDHAEASIWFEDAADQGVPGACYYLGVMSLEGDAVEQSNEDAAYWFERGAAQQHPASMLAMGDLYRDGTGVDQDVKQARAWYRKAKAQNEDTEVQSAAAARLEELEAAEPE